MGGSVLDPNKVARDLGISEGDVTKYQQGVTALSLDPGGLVYTAPNKDVAAMQAKLDVGGYGAKKTVALREAAAQAAQQTKEAQAAAQKEARLVSAQQGIAAEQKRRLDDRRRRMIERGSLMYGMDQGGATTLG